MSLYNEFVEIANTGDPLDASIAKWELLVTKIEAGEVFRDPDGRRLIGRHTCGLCITYYRDECHGCPIMKATGLPECSGTPYTRAYAELNDYVNHRPTINIKPFKDELEFLRSLRK